MSDGEYAVAAQRVRKNIRQFLSGQRVKSILLYTARPAWREVDVSDLKHLLGAMSCDDVPMNKNAQPPKGVYDVVFVPLLGFNDQGYRLGRGGGWYDRLLATQPWALKVGIGFEDGRIDFRVDPHDIAMDVIITESEIIAKDQ
jgi:5-formyltetrahydrofolate cyclo-ligase